MTDIFDAIQRSAKRIKKAIDVKDIGYSSQSNSSGETQLQLDIQCDYIIEEEFSKVPSVHTIASEEKENEQLLHEDGKYFIAYDPLDGSSLVDVNLSVERFMVSTKVVLVQEKWLHLAMLFMDQELRWYLLTTR